MAGLDLFEGGVELGLQLFGDAAAKDVRDLVGRQTPESDLATALEDAVNGAVTLEDEVPAALNLRNRREAVPVHLLALLDGELRSQQQRPEVEPLPDDLGTEAVGRRL